MNIREQIDAAWLANSTQDQRTQEAYSQFYHDHLNALGIKPIKARHDKAGNCKRCGEAGRCPGWHYKGEFPAIKKDGQTPSRSAKTPKPKLTPTAPHFKLRRKLMALAERGINGEKTSAIEKLARLEARYDFTVPDPETKVDLFAGTFQRSTIAAKVFHFTDLQNDVAANVKWAIEHATGIPCLFRDRDLYAEAAQTCAGQLATIAATITAGFDTLWHQFSTAPTVTPADRPLFHMGLYGGMMGEERAGLLPTRSSVKTRRGKAKTVPSLALHPYSVAYNLGKQIRFSVPLSRISGDLERTIKGEIETALPAAAPVSR